MTYHTRDRTPYQDTARGTVPTSPAQLGQYNRNLYSMEQEMLGPPGQQQPNTLMKKSAQSAQSRMPDTVTFRIRSTRRLLMHLAEMLIFSFTSSTIRLKLITSTSVSLTQTM